MKKPLSFLMWCGILSSIIYIATDLITGFITPAYSFNSQTVSELSAIGAPTRFIWQIVTFIYNPLLLAFGWGIRALGISQKSRTLSLTGLLLIIWGILGFIWLFFPMHLRGNLGSSGDLMHLVMTALTVLLMTTLIIVGSATRGKFFKIYSLVTLLMMIIFGIITGQQTGNVAVGLPTPWMGITERATSYGPLFWVIVLALSFL